MNKIGVLGSGMIGGQVARLSIAAGYEVYIANSRGPESLKLLNQELGEKLIPCTIDDLILATDCIVVAIPFATYRSLPDEKLAGKIIVNTMNYYPERDGIIDEVRTDIISTSELVQAHLKNSFVVRGINNVDYIRLLGRAMAKGDVERSALPIACNHEEAKLKVTQFLDDIGYDAVDMGLLSESWRSEPTTPVYVSPYWAFNEQDSHNLDKISFLNSPGRIVNKEEVKTLLAQAVRHNKMYGTLGSFDDKTKRK